MLGPRATDAANVVVFEFRVPGTADPPNATRPLPPSSPATSTSRSWTKPSPANHPLASAALDRLRHNAYCLTLDGESFRAPRQLLLLILKGGSVAALEQTAIVRADFERGAAMGTIGGMTIVRGPISGFTTAVRLSALALASTWKRWLPRACLPLRSPSIFARCWRRRRVPESPPSLAPTVPSRSPGLPCTETAQGTLAARALMHS